MPRKDNRDEQVQQVINPVDANRVAPAQPQVQSQAGAQPTYQEAQTTFGQELFGIEAGFQPDWTQLGAGAQQILYAVASNVKKKKEEKQNNLLTFDTQSAKDALNKAQTPEEVNEAINILRNSGSKYVDKFETVEQDPRGLFWAGYSETLSSSDQQRYLSWREEVFGLEADGQKLIGEIDDSILLLTTPLTPQQKTNPKWWDGKTLDKVAGHVVRGTPSFMAPNAVLNEETFLLHRGGMDELLGSGMSAPDAIRMLGAAFKRGRALDLPNGEVLIESIGSHHSSTSINQIAQAIVAGNELGYVAAMYIPKGRLREVMKSQVPVGKYRNKLEDLYNAADDPSIDVNSIQEIHNLVTLQNLDMNPLSAAELDFSRRRESQMKRAMEERIGAEGPAVGLQVLSNSEGPYYEAFVDINTVLNEMTSEMYGSEALYYANGIWDRNTLSNLEDIAVEIYTRLEGRIADPTERRIMLKSMMKRYTNMDAFTKDPNSNSLVMDRGGFVAAVTNARTSMPHDKSSEGIWEKTTSPEVLDRFGKAVGQLPWALIENSPELAKELRNLNPRLSADASSFSWYMTNDRAVSDLASRYGSEYIDQAFGSLFPNNPNNLSQTNKFRAIIDKIVGPGAGLQDGLLNMAAYRTVMQQKDPTMPFPKAGINGPFDGLANEIINQRKAYEKGIKNGTIQLVVKTNIHREISLELMDGGKMLASMPAPGHLVNLIPKATREQLLIKPRLLGPFKPQVMDPEDYNKLMMLQGGPGGFTEGFVDHGIGVIRRPMPGAIRHLGPLQPGHSVDGEDPSMPIRNIPLR